MIRVHLVNESTKVTAAQAKDLATGLTVYGNMVAAYWNLATVRVVCDGGDWEFHIVDQFPPGAPAGVLGYHDLVGDKVVAYISTQLTMAATAPTPFGIITPEISVDGVVTAPEGLYPQSLGEVLSHELAEAMVDPFVNRYAFDGSKMWMVEVGDHADAYRFKLVFGTRKVQMICQDFTLPSFYDRQGVAPFSHTGKVSQRFTVDAGCYAYTVDAGAAHSVGVDK